MVIAGTISIVQIFSLTLGACTRVTVVVLCVSVCVCVCVCLSVCYCASCYIPGLYVESEAVLSFLLPQQHARRNLIFGPYFAKGPQSMLESNALHCIKFLKHTLLPLKHGELHVQGILIMVVKK